MYKYSNIMYCGINIEDYCNNNNIKFAYIKYKLKSYKNKKEKLLPLDIQIQLAIKNYTKRNKYTDLNYKGLKLVEYCKSTNIEYVRIAYRCRYFIKKGNDFSLLNESQIKIFVDNYYYKLEIKELKETFNKLDICNNSDYKSICNKLNINYDKLKQLKSDMFDFKTLIYICWYSNDMCDDKGIYISQSKLNNIIFENGLQLVDLYGIYKSGNINYLEKILEYEKYYLISLVLRTIKEYNFKINKSDYEDLFSEARIIFTKCITRNVFNNTGRILRYIEKSVTKQILTYLIENYSNKYYQFDDTRREKIKLKEQWEY